MQGFAIAQSLSGRLEGWNGARRTKLHDVRSQAWTTAHIVHRVAAMAAMFSVEDRCMHPQIANSFISLLGPRERAKPPRFSWFRRLLGRA